MRPICFLLSISAAALIAQTNDPDRVLSALQDRALADQAFRLKTDDRIALYQGMAGAKTENLHYRNLLAGALIQKMRETTDYAYLDRASTVLAEVLAADFSNYEALRLRTEIELERHHFSNAAAYSRQLTARAPDDSWNWGTLGDSLIELGDYDHAADAYQKMVSLHPDLASYNRAAWYRFLTGDIEGAVGIMKQAISSGSASPENIAWCIVELGNLYMKAGRADDAEQAYRTASKVFPGYHSALAGLGRALAAKGDWNGAIESYRRAQQSTPLPDYAAALYDLYSELGQKAQAQKQMELIDVIDTLGRAAQEKVNRNLALIFADHDRRLDRALQLATAELEVRGDIYTYDVLAWALYKNGKYREAETAMAKAMKLKTPEAAFYYHAGMIACALDKKADAAQYLRKALEINPQFDLRQSPLAQSTLKRLLT